MRTLQKPKGIRLEITQSMERLNEVLAKKAKEDREELRNNLKDFQEAFSKCNSQRVAKAKF